MDRRLALASISVLVVMAGQFDARSDYRDIPTKPKAGDKMLAEYFELETRDIEAGCFGWIHSKEDWEASRSLYRHQLSEMLGLYPLPKRTPLNARITGKETHEDIVVEKVVFESSPKLYVTGNYYRPAKQEGPLPTILYVCGHGPAKKNGVSYGNKVSYQHHGAWFARNGYTCLAIDTLQMGEIEGIHHGTYRYDRWWWHSRGYTSAGVEAWNCMRALDYLETRKEVDKNKFGVTGRSGGGAYSWWISALDDRIKVAVPVAGIASLRNHVVDGCVEGHCDCMFQVNTYRWDYPMIAALVAPRPLLIANTDKDTIFPLDGVVDVYTKTRRIYKLLGAEKNIGLGIYEGPHKDTQPLRTVAFHWFERFLKGRSLTDEMTDTTAPKPFAMEQLKVLKELPDDEKNTKIDETFTKRVSRDAKIPASVEEWKKQREQWMSNLRARVFGGWPYGNDLDEKRMESSDRDGVRFTRYEFTSQQPWRLSLFVAHPVGKKRGEFRKMILHVLDDEDWKKIQPGLRHAFPQTFANEDQKEGSEAGYRQLLDTARGPTDLVAWVAPRGIGLSEWTSDPKERTQILRRFPLVGQTLDGMRVWDIKQAVQAVRVLHQGREESGDLAVKSSRLMAGNVVYATLFEPDLGPLYLSNLPASHRKGGPVYLNVLRFLDMPQALSMAIEKTPVILDGADPRHWNYPTQLGKLLDWRPEHFRIEAPEKK